MSHSADPTVIAIYYQATTMTLAAIVACQIGNLFACRTEWVSTFTLSWTNNRLLWLGIGTECAALLAFIHFPPFSRVFTTAPLAPWQWLLLLAFPAIMLGLEEFRKAMLRNRHRKQRHSHATP